MGRTAGQKHRLAYTILCEWCGERKESSREDMKTCGEACRLRLSRFRARFGYEPDEPPGRTTARFAIDLEVHRLIVQEQRRRAAERAERDHYLSLAVVTPKVAPAPKAKKGKKAPKHKRKTPRRHMSVASSA